MQIHQLRLTNKSKKRIGRGGKRGNYSGRGIKGQKARAGRKIKPNLGEVILKLPRKRGLGNIKIRKNIFEINLGDINNKFNDGEEVNLMSLKEKKILRVAKSIKNYRVKILGEGKLDKVLIFRPEFIFSSRALKKIELSGSKIL